MITFVRQHGSMTRDLNKGIPQMQYGKLGIPKLVDINSPVGESRITYKYSATGERWETYYRWNSNYSTNPIIGSDVNTSLLNKSR